MAFEKVKYSDISIYFPWKISTSDIQPNILLMCKMLVVLLLINGFYSKINDPYLPFIRWFDFFNNYPGFFKNTLRFGFVFFGLMLMINIKTKWSSFVLGLIIILTLLASKPFFRNHIFIVGCVLFLVGLSNNKGLPWLIILQISLLYFGASLNKALEIDWWTGQFMHNWLGYARNNVIYNDISNMLPHLWFAKILSWMSIIVEFTIGVSILTKKWRLLGIWLMIIFHFGMFTILDFTFGHFVQDLFIILIAFLNWPQENVTIRYNENKSIFFRKMIKLLDWDKLYNWQIETDKLNNSFEIENLKNFQNKPNSIIFLFLYTEGFYVLIFMFEYFMARLRHFFEPSFAKFWGHIIFCIVIWILILYFLSISIKNSNTTLSKNINTQKIYRF